MMTPLVFTRTSRATLTTSNGANITELINCATELAPYQALETQYFLGYAVYLETVSSVSYLPSKNRAPFPSINPEDSSSEKLAAFQEIQENYPSVGLKVLFKKGSGGWENRSIVNLQNRGQEVVIPLVVPYLTTNLVKLLSKDDSVGFQVINLGSGTLGVGDYINIECEFRIELTLVEKPQIRAIASTASYGITVPTDSPVRFRAANNLRAILYAVNTGLNPIWIGAANNISIGNGLLLTEGGSFSEQLLLGEFWAIAEGGASRISGLEASYAS